VLRCVVLVWAALAVSSNVEVTAASRQDAEGSRVDVKILTTILRDVVGPRRAVLAKPNATPIVGLVNTTLSVCPPVVTAPCVYRDVYEAAQREAAKGTWSMALTTAFREAAASGANVPTFAYPELAIGTRAALRASHGNPAFLDVSKPAIVSGKALVLVHFAGAYSWLVLLVESGSEWKVSEVVLVGIG